MIKEKIQKYFQRDPNLRVLFFFDADKSWLTEVEELNLADVLVMKWNFNDFYLKTQLHGPLKTSKVFLYFPFEAPRSQEQYHRFPLLGLLMANKELSLEDEGEFMQEFGLQRHHHSLVKKYIRELKYSNVQEVCKPLLNAASFEDSSLVKGLISAFLRFNRIETWPVIVGRILILALPGEEVELKRFQKKINENDLFETISTAVRECLGSNLPDLQQASLKLQLTRIRYNLLTHTINALPVNDPYRSLKIKESDILNHMQQLVQEMERHEKLSAIFREALEWASGEIKAEKLIEIYGDDPVFAAYTSEMVYEIIARQKDKVDVNPSSVKKRLEEITFQKDLNPSLQELLRFMIQVCTMNEFINSISTYILDKPEDYVQKYTGSWYQIDMAYRRAISYLRNIDLTEVPSKIAIEDIREKLNKKYDAYCEQLNREWLKCLAQFRFDFRKLNVPKQFEFFQNQVAPYEQKVVVIISDALRFEVAQELLSEMHADPKNTADITYQLAGLPSKTFIGMAQLLPGKNFRFGDGNITLDGISTEGTDNRRKLLEAVNPEATAVSFVEIQSFRQEEMRALFKRPLVYIYHDEIDSTGDTRKAEQRVFDAAKNTIEELKRFVKSLHASYNVARVLITSDHGFIYNDRKIEEADKESLSGKDAVLSGNRFEIVKEAFNPVLGYCVPIGATTAFSDNLFVVIPESVNRYKKQGVGHQYAHGGGSLQELIVPIIESSRKRQDVTTRVNVLLMQKTLAIASNVLRVNVLQENKVSRNEKEREISLGIYHRTELVSNQEKVLLNSTSDLPTDRMVRIELSLLTGAFDQTLLKLKIFDVDDMLNPLIESQVENKNLIEPDF